MPRRRLQTLVAGLAPALLIAAGCSNGEGASAGQPDSVESVNPAGQPACVKSVRMDVPQPTTAHLEAAGLGNLPIAQDQDRVDLVAPAFSNSTKVDNRLFPISDLHSVLLNGTVEGKPFRTETTLLPDTRVIEWSPGQCVRALVSQYVAYLDGRIEEVALDFYAQADDGSVWYFGEDVFNYDGGVVADLSGTWFAGKEGPAAMIMPADPHIGDVNRPENIPGLVFEEVAVAEIDKTVDGPRGPVAGAIVGRELHDDGSYSDKVFAPAYGEFYSAHEGDVEALALAVPTDHIDGGVPGQLQTMSANTGTAFEAAESGRWPDAIAAVEQITSAWAAHIPRAAVPPRLIEPTEQAMDELTQAVREQDALAARHAALDAMQSVLDLQLQFETPVEIDRARFDLWARQVQVDAAADDIDAIAGDVATLEWIRDRIAASFDDVAVAAIDATLAELRTGVADDELEVVVEAATALREFSAAATD
jgi:hypothetical protein